jgi:hypothetical protein
MTAPHRSNRRRRGLAPALVALVLLASAPTVGAHGPDPVLGGGLFAQDQALEFRWRSGSEPPSIIRTAIRNAASDSNATRASRAPTFVYDAAGPSVIGYGTGTCGVNGIGCFTRDAPNDFTMWLREHGRVYDWGTLRWCQISNTTGCYDAETVALDEFGHVAILGHHVNYSDDRDYTDAVVQTYSRTKPKAGYDMHVYGVCDTARLQLEYDIPTASAPYSTCLDVPTILTLTSSPASVGYRGTATLTAVLKVVTDTAHRRLSGNPVSKRTVRLQARTVGTTTWSTIATMTPTSPTGSYVASRILIAATDFRAVFSTPSAEGLIGDTSPTVRVSVAPCTIDCPLPSAPR